jgi:hypothetical protein
LARPGPFEAAVRRELPRWGAARPCLRIMRAVFAALADTGLATTITGLTAAGAAAILAETGDPGEASPNVPRGTHLAHEHGQPRPLLTQLDSRCREQPA